MLNLNGNCVNYFSTFWSRGGNILTNRLIINTKYWREGLTPIVPIELKDHQLAEHYSTDIIGNCSTCTAFYRRYWHVRLVAGTYAMHQYYKVFYFVRVVLTINISKTKKKYFLYKQITVTCFAARKFRRQAFGNKICILF